MIEILEGTHEIVRFEEGSVTKLHDNREMENYPMHWHQPVEIIMPVENSYEINCLKDRYLLREEDVLLVQPGVLHGCVAPSDGRRFFCQVAVPPPLASARMHSIINLTLPPVMLVTPELNAELHASVRELLYQAYRERDSAAFMADFTKYLCVLEVIRGVYMFYEKNAQRYTDANVCKLEVAKALQLACDHICVSYAEPITLEDAALIAGFSKFHFSRLFHLYTGDSFSHYLNAVRMSNAQVMLSEAALSITQVAYAVGYSSMSSFIRMFRSFYGCTPSEYRRMLEKR